MIVYTDYESDSSAGYHLPPQRAEAATAASLARPAPAQTVCCSDSAQRCDCAICLRLRRGARVFGWGYAAILWITALWVNAERWLV